MQKHEINSAVRVYRRGKVAKIIAKGFLSAGIIKANDIFASSIAETDLDYFRSMGCHATNNNKSVVKESKFVFHAMRANVYPGVLKDIWQDFRVYLGVRTCEVFLCVITIIFLDSIVLTSLFSLFYVTCEGNRFLHRG